MVKKNIRHYLPQTVVGQIATERAKSDKVGAAAELPVGKIVPPYQQFFSNGLYWFWHAHLGKRDLVDGAW